MSESDGCARWPERASRSRCTVLVTRVLESRQPLGFAAAGWAARCAVLYVFGVIATTCAVLAGAFSIGTLAATPSRVAGGRLWLLLSSALVADRPVAVCLASFVGFAIVALAVCRGGTFWLAATFGHVGSTVVVYVLVAVVRLVEPGVLHHLLDMPDFGVSAIQAAWLDAAGADDLAGFFRSRVGRLGEPVTGIDDPGVCHALVQR